MRVSLTNAVGQQETFDASNLDEVMAKVGPNWPVTIDGVKGYVTNVGDDGTMVDEARFVRTGPGGTPITAELLWLIHRAALGGVSAATGDKLPETLAENKFKAVKMSHYGMAVVMAGSGPF